MTVEAPSRPPEPARTGVSGDTAKRVAGSEGDPTKVVGSLPGVARAPLGSGEVLVWGADAADTRVFVDGIPVPALYHFGGVRGIVPSEAVGGIELVPGAFGPDYGRALAGLVHVSLLEPSREGLHGTAAIDTLDASLQGELMHEGAAALAAGRYGYLDRLVEAVAPETAPQYVVPRYFDGAAAVDGDFGRARLGARVLFGSDEVTRATASADPQAVRSDRRERVFVRGGVPISYLHEGGSRTKALVFWGYDRGSQESRFGPQPLSLESRAWIWGVRTEHGFHVAGPVHARVGLDVEGRHAALARAGSLTLPPREGDMAVFGQAPAEEIATDTWEIERAAVGPYASIDTRIGPVAFSIGGRADFTLTVGDIERVSSPGIPPVGFARLEPTFDPRAAVSLALGRLELFAAGGGYHQPVPPEDLSAVFGNPELESARAIVASGGQRVRIIDELRLEVTGFFRSLDEIVARSRLANPASGRILTTNGEGRSFGAQLLLKLNPLEGFSGWLAYTLSRSERKIDVEPSYRLFDGDQPHVLTTVLGYEIAGWAFGLRFRAASGAPRNTVIDSYYNAKADRYEPIFGPRTRYDTFYQLDLRVEHRFDLDPVTLALYLDVQNVTYHRHPEELAYSYDYAEAEPILGLPTLAVAGARLSL